jgi:hypothetical protein
VPVMFILLVLGEVLVAFVSTHHAQRQDQRQPGQHTEGKDAFPRESAEQAAGARRRFGVVRLFSGVGFVAHIGLLGVIGLRAARRLGFLRSGRRPAGDDFGVDDHGEQTTRGSFPASSAWPSRSRFPPGSCSAMTESSESWTAELPRVTLCR